MQPITLSHKRGEGESMTLGDLVTGSRRSGASSGWLHRVVAAVALAAISVAGLSTFAVAASAVETGTGSGGVFVQDGANALSDSTRQYIRQSNEKWEKDRELPAQLLVVTADKVPDGQTIETWSMDLAEKYKPGDKGKDTGLVYVVAVDDHKDRLEVGYGLEDKIPDAMAAKMIREAEAKYKQGDYDAGVRALVDAVGDQLYGDGWTPSPGDSSGAELDILIWVIVLSLSGFSFLLLPIIIIITVIRTPVGSYYGSTGSCGSDGGWISSSSSDSRSSSSSSFGGGSFGGGGASGSW